MSNQLVHICDSTCVAASQVDCGCSSAPTMCDDCVEYFTYHDEFITPVAGLASRKTPIN